MSNETISKWLGECRHEGGWEVVRRNDYKGPICLKCGYPLASPDYENDESAWTREVYGKIEEAGLKVNFITQLIIVLKITSEAGEKLRLLEGSLERHETSKVSLAYFDLFDIAKATPAQKAAALSRAIEEASDVV